MDVQQQVRPGQIIQGKIIKLYPNNKAEIPLGSQKMVAQLEAALNIGKEYHFQVQTATDVIHLKVLGEIHQSHLVANAEEIIRSLGLKMNKLNIEFVQMLIKEKIPFDRTQLLEVFQLLGSRNNKQEAFSILKSMIATKIPISESIFQALYTKDTSELSQLMNSLLGQLSQTHNITALQKNVVEQLGKMLDRPSNHHDGFLRLIMNEAQSNNQQLFSILRAVGLIDEEIDFSTWRTAWQAFNNSNQTHGGMGNMQTPFPINETSIEKSLTQLVTNQVSLRGELENFLQKWTISMEHSIQNNRSMHQAMFTSLYHEFNDRIAPSLSQEFSQTFMKMLQNNPSKLQELMIALQLFTNEKTYVKMEQILLQREATTFSVMKEQFITHMKQYLQLFGLTDEHLLKENQLQKYSSTVKSMLFQLLQEGDNAVNQRAQHLIHFINGLQLQSINESSNFIQASLQIPGEKFSLQGDIRLDFESRKTADGKINADYCRILFYLHLKNLQETMIDMQVQKRIISITIFNDQENIKDQARIVQPLLEKGLKELNYQLSTVTIKPFKQSNEPMKGNLQQNQQISHEGVDFRV